MSNYKSLSLLICVLLVATGVTSSCAQTPPRDQSKIAIMIKTLLSEGTEPDLRHQQALILLADSQAHELLLDALQQEGSTTANIIVCRTIATGPLPLFADPLAEEFVPLLLKGADEAAVLPL